MRRIAWTVLVALVLAAPAAAEDEEKYSAEELAEIVGPIALYPDIVLSSVLPASAAPMDVVQAARWLAKQKGEVKGAPEDSTWEEAVQALVQFPDVLIWMNENLDWMGQLAFAVSVQQEDVLAAIQAFRKKAQEAGNLESNDKQKVVEEDDSVEIQPVEPEVIYVPQYNPVYVVQPAATYPPSYRGTFWAGFTAGVVGAWAWHTIRWGRPGHYPSSLNINRSATFNFNRSGGLNRPRPGDGGRRWASTKPARRGPGGGAPRAQGKVAKPRSPTWNQKRSPARSPRGGMKAPTKRPSRSPSNRPRATKPKTRAPSSRAGGANRPDRGKPRARPKSSLGGSRSSGAQARKQSQRGRSSRASSRSSRPSSSGRSRGGRSGGGRSRGGGGGGGRR